MRALLAEKQSKEKPAASPRRVSRSGVAFELGQAQLATARASQSDQSGAEQAQRARLRN
jgi:hypothetical protein